MSSPSLPGNLSLEQLKAAAVSGEIDTVLVAFPDLYGRLMGKRVTARYFLKSVAEGGMHVCDYLLACDMEMVPVPGYKFTNWETGYGDLHCVPDMATLRRAAWLDRTALVICDLKTDPGDVPIEVSPRRMLQRQLEQAREMGFSVMGGTEIELYLFDETYESARGKRYAGLQPAGSYVEDYHLFQGTKEEGVIGAIRRGLEASGIPVESSKGEWGPGQQEINIDYSEALAQADRNVLYKHAAREIAYANGKAVTFMAKWDETQAGSSMHVHVSLWDTAQEKSLFKGEGSLGPVECSEMFRWFLGGWMKHARELSAFYAPNVSSYKRYQSGSFAPTGIAWSRDNRTAGFRVVGHGPSLRVECRIPGADANPYLVYAAAVAAGLDGIRNRTEPPPVFQGDIYQAKELPRIPSTLREAITELEQSGFARQAFGEDVVEHYLHFLRTEQRKFDEVVTDWEKARFFERI
jgi:glutamine synthetase